MSQQDAREIRRAAANISMVYTGGAATPTAGNNLEVNGSAQDGVVHAGFNQNSQAAVPAGVTSKLTWVSASASASTVMAVRIDGSELETVQLTGANGSVDLGGLAVAEGGLMSVAYISGTAPGAMNAQVHMLKPA